MVSASQENGLGSFGCERDVGEIHCELGFIIGSALQKP
jgi:hypothetical protein